MDCLGPYGLSVMAAVCVLALPLLLGNTGVSKTCADVFFLVYSLCIIGACIRIVGAILWIIGVSGELYVHFKGV